MDDRWYVPLNFLCPTSPNIRHCSIAMNPERQVIFRHNYLSYGIKATVGLE